MPITATAAPPIAKPMTVPAKRAHHGRAGGKRVRPQHRQRAETDPERVLRIDEPGEQHRERQPDRAADAVLQPHRVPVEVPGRDSLRDRDGTDLVDRSGRRPSSLAHHGRESAAAIAETVRADSATV